MSRETSSRIRGVGTTSTAAGRGGGRGRMAAVGSAGSFSNIGGDSMSELTSGMTGLSVPVVSELLARPGTGKVGRHIALIANYYELTLNSKITLFRYEIVISRPGRRTRLD
ncbi:unnamed protein product, partial [Anisakis simplex]|uniref:Coat protein n=1 Tax=Anisakis simplex TaxID=6269 RepID=A0A0M3J5I9_ANISI